ncbi:unnamed protein product [Rotaria sp. Silwood2]|nr:unnamed protein product [Rotaria sp. Silwood2]CAF2480630.1 unnamed protein product [Rotaria sp. Silwood2]CAF2714053.1 unnamed protein product [Rotaria sp. Silwood2]CAF2864954.1 unnamed protein product [Rotaria sp. Silwood2]CAF3860289.1 unnamed protein product [Rotaria sp. Silwood2]
MEFNSTSQYIRRKNSSYEKKSSDNLSKSRSIVVRTSKSNNDNLRINSFIYRTEFYLQQREKQYVEKSLSTTTITTWKNLKYQKQILDNDQVEIDRVLSTLDSIHKTLNRSLFMPYNKVYSSLYGNNNKSDRLMKTFCQCQNHYVTYELSMKIDDDDDDDDNDDESQTQVISSSFGNFEDTDFDDTTENEEENENENEKKKSYDSGYGSVLPMRQYSREPLLKMTQPWSIN